MKTVFFIFKTKESLKNSENLLRDILYYGFGIRVVSLTKSETNIEEIAKREDCFLIYIEDEKTKEVNKCRRFLQGLTSEDFVEEINQCLN